MDIYFFLIFFILVFSILIFSFNLFRQDSLNNATIRKINTTDDISDSSASASAICLGYDRANNKGRAIDVDSDGHVKVDVQSFKSSYSHGTITAVNELNAFSSAIDTFGYSKLSVTVNAPPGGTPKLQILWNETGGADQRFAMNSSPFFANSSVLPIGFLDNTQADSSTAVAKTAFMQMTVLPARYFIINVYQDSGDSMVFTYYVTLEN